MSLAKHRYVIFTVACCCGALLFTDLKFSSLMTFSAAIQCLGFCVLLLQVVRGRGIASISVRTLVLYVILFTFRLYATCFYESYIPVDLDRDECETDRAYKQFICEYLHHP